MPMPQQENRFPELREILNSATEAENGVRVSYPSLRHAQGALMRIRAVIGDSRRESKKLFDLDDPRWGKSPYDGLDVALDRPYIKGDPDGERPGQVILRKLNDAYMAKLNITIEDL